MGLQLRKIKIRSKKGQTDFVSLFFALAVIFGLAIFFLILSYLNGQIQAPLSEGLAGAATPEADINTTKILEQTDAAILTFDPLFPLILIGVGGFIMVTALMTKSHMAFLFLGLLILGVGLILAAVYANVYQGLAESDDFTTTNDDFNIMGLFLENLPIVIIILFILIALVLYGVNRSPGGGGGL